MAYRLLTRPDGASAYEPSSPDHVEGRIGDGSMVWLDVATRDPAEIEELGHRFGFEPAAIEDVLDVEQLPKFDVHEDHLFVVLHALTFVADRVDTLELDCFVRGGLLVTVHAEPVVAVEWLWDAAQSYPQIGELAPPELFAQLTEVVGRRYLEILDEFERQVDDLSDRALAADRTVLAEIQFLRREEATIRRVLRPQRLVITTLRSRNLPILTPAATTILNDAYDVHNLVVESLASARGLLTDTLDTYRGASAEREASATAVLTVYAAILLPLSLITGWYGMNVADLPLTEEPWGWMVVTAGMAVVAVVSWLVFVRMGIVRTARGGRARRPIVRSLADAAKAPVKPVTMLWRPNGEARAVTSVTDRLRPRR
ncbi:MAG: magnesium transporter CorA family protein [Acidimicrobiales bacterium]